MDKLWENINCGTSGTCDIYQNTEQFLSAICNDHTEKLQSKLPSQGFLICFHLGNSFKKPNWFRSKAQSKLVQMC